MTTELVRCVQCAGVGWSKRTRCSTPEHPGWFGHVEPCGMCEGVGFGHFDTEWTYSNIGDDVVDKIRAEVEAAKARLGPYPYESQGADRVVLLQVPRLPARPTDRLSKGEQLWLDQYCKRKQQAG